MKITRQKFEGFVYNIEVVDNHNYFANTILVSNCHENSSSLGLHGDILNLPFIVSLSPWTELAIGGGNPLIHPNLIEFLGKCKRKNKLCC